MGDSFLRGGCMPKKDIVWVPSKKYIENANITRFMKTHNIKDYDELIERSTRDIEWFWDAAVKDLGIEWFKPYEKILDSSQGIEWTQWFCGGQLNIAYNCLDRYAQLDKEKERVAVIWEGEDGKTREISYRELYVGVNQCANFLRSLGVGRGDRVGIYMPMVPETVMGFFAIMKIGAIAVPIFSGFGWHALASRLRISGARVVLTADGTTRRGKPVMIKQEIDRARSQSQVKQVVVYRHQGLDVPMGKRDYWWHEHISSQSGECECEVMESEDRSMIIFSSGTTGMPKGTVHTHAGALAQISKEVAYYFDVKKNDRFFWLTDIGWMMGPWMMIGALCLGGTIFMYDGVPNFPGNDRLWDMIERHRVTILGISPTVIRLLMRYGKEPVRQHDVKSLRILGSTGEPWDPESWMWFFKTIGKGCLPIINISGGTEIVGCFLSPLPITVLKPCTLRGPGLGMAVDVCDDQGKSVRGQMGHLVARKPAPSMTRGFWNDPERYLKTYWSRWPGVWYHGDWASVDQDGFWFLHGRSDDTIKVAGRRTGPAEIESVLMGHPGVTEAAVIGVPHEIKGEDLVCFVVLKPGFSPSEDLRGQLMERVIKTMGKTLRPREMKFVRDLPKTRSAKIVRRMIRSVYLGEDPGDVSSIDNPGALEAIEQAH